MRAPVDACIGLGANLGDAQQAVRAAAEALGQTPGIETVALSARFGSAPLDAGGPDYVNAVLRVRTTLNAMALLDSLQRIENEAGRERPYRHAPRTLDLDLLLYGDARIASSRLLVPHPRMWQRAFVLQPLAQVAPEWVTPDLLDAVATQAVWQI